MGNDTINLLITTAGGSGIYPFIEAVKESKYNINLILVDSSEIAGALYEVKKSYIIPQVNNKCYLKHLKAILKKENIAYLISLLDEELIYLSDKDIGVKTLIPSKKALIKSWDKIETFYCLKEYFSNTFVLSEKLDLKKIWNDYGNLLLKPAQSRGCRGIIIPEDFEEFEFFAKRFLKKNTPYLIQEFIKGKEYNISTLHDKNGNLIYAIARWKFEKRVIKSGSKASVIVENENVVQFALKVLKKLNLEYGFNNVEVIENEDGIFLLEVNAGRIAAQDMNIVKAGINIVDLFIDIVEDRKIEKVIPKIGICNIKTSRDIWTNIDIITKKTKEYNEIANSCCPSR